MFSFLFFLYVLGVVNAAVEMAPVNSTTPMLRSAIEPMSSAPGIVATW